MNTKLISLSKGLHKIGSINFLSLPRKNLPVHGRSMIFFQPNKTYLIYFFIFHLSGKVAGPLARGVLINLIRNKSPCPPQTPRGGGSCAPGARGGGACCARWRVVRCWCMVATGIGAAHGRRRTRAGPGRARRARRRGTSEH